MGFQTNRSNNNYTNRGSSGGSSGAAGKSQQRTSDKPDVILEKLMRPSKSGKSVATFSVGEEDIVLPANTRVVISALSEKQIQGLERTYKERGFKTQVPTHKLSVFKIESK